MFLEHFTVRLSSGGHFTVSPAKDLEVFSVNPKAPVNVRDRGRWPWTAAASCLLPSWFVRFTTNCIPAVILVSKCLSWCLAYSKWSVNVSYFQLNQTQRLTMGAKRVTMNPSCYENLITCPSQTVFCEMLLGVLWREKCPVFQKHWENCILYPLLDFAVDLSVGEAF